MELQPLDAIAKERVWAVGGDLEKIALFELVAFGPDSADNERESATTMRERQRQ